jgi:transcriptional regulator
MVYRPPHFDEPRAAVLEEFITRHGFATLVSQGPGGLMASHVPLLYEPQRGPRGTLWGHLARANPQLADLTAGSEVMAIFHGPHAYVSPGWYATHPSVPTWNYAVIHAYGTIEPIADPAALHALVARLADTYEEGRPVPWRLADQPEPYIRGMLRGIGGFGIAVTRLEGKFKLSQNRDAVDRGRVIAGLEAAGDPESRATAALMVRRAAEDEPAKT